MNLSMLLDTVFSFELLLKNLCSSCHNMLSFSCIQQFSSQSPYDETSGVLFLVSVISFLFFWWNRYTGKMASPFFFFLIF